MIPINLKNIFITVLLCLAGGSIQAQQPTASEIENTVCHYLQRLKYWQAQKADYSIDSAYEVNFKLRDYMNLMQHEALMLTAPFKKMAANGMVMQASEDGKCRTFVWLVTKSDAMVYRNSLLVYNATTEVDGILHKDGFVTAGVHSLRTTTGSTVYLVNILNTYPKEDRSSGIGTYVIDGTIFADKLFFYGSVDSQAYIGYRYDIPTYKAPVSNLPLTRLSPGNKRVCVPIIRKGGKYEGLNIYYKYDGDKFVYEKVGK
ncbi:MAG: hypothetical protein H0X33_13705 [Taibaiella sp.]|nr:hypothetical protein [Taibaiella sp.]